MSNSSKYYGIYFSWVQCRWNQTFKPNFEPDKVPNVLGNFQKWRFYKSKKVLKHI